MDDLCRASARMAAAAIRRGELAPRELVSACLHHIGEREETVGAWQVLDHIFIDAALDRLDTIPKAERGPLYGIPVGVKDIYDTADLPTSYGSEIYAGHQPAWDAAAVARLRAAGAVVLGKTVTTEFAYWKAGKTRNPHDTGRTPGGSSSGSAAAVADCMVPLATGSQTVASTMRPAAYCGVVGFKPSFGRISVTGIKTLAGSLDTVGAFARTVADAALMAAVMAGRDDWLTETAPGAPPTLRLARTPDWKHVTPAGIAAVERAARMLESDGAALREGTAPDAFAKLGGIQNTVLAFEAARDFSSEWLHHRDRISRQLTELIEEGLATAPADYEAALAARARCLASIEDLFDGAAFLLAPSATGEAPPIEQGTGDPIMSRAWTLLGLPSISLPCGTGPAGLPLGLQIAARPGQDAALVGAALWIAARLGGERDLAGLAL